MLFLVFLVTEMIIFKDTLDLYFHQLMIIEFF